MMFVGLHDHRGAKRYAWMEVSSADADLAYTAVQAAARLYKKQVQKGATPGAIYLVPTEAQEDGGLLVTLDAGTWHGVHHDEALVAQLRAEHRAATTKFQAEGKAAQERAQQHDLALLEPLRLAYWSMPRSARNAFLVNVMDAVTRSAPPKGVK